MGRLGEAGLPRRRRPEREPGPAPPRDDQCGLPARERLLDDATVADVDEPVGDRGRRGVVADDDRGRPGAADELAEQPVDDAGVLGVELARGLVGEQQARPVCDSGADRDPLLLAAGEAAGQVVRPARAGRRGPAARRRAARPACGGEAEQLELEGDAVPAAEVGRERARVVLIEQADVVRAKRGGGRAVESAEVGAEDAGGSGREPVEPGEDAQERRLSRRRSGRARRRSRRRRARGRAPAARRSRPGPSRRCGRRLRSRSRGSLEAPGGSLRACRRGARAGRSARSGRARPRRGWRAPRGRSTSRARSAAAGRGRSSRPRR